MYGSNPISQVLIAISRNGESCIDNHITELLLLGEALDALYQVLVAIAISRDDMANQGDRAKGPPLVHGVEKRVALDSAKLEAGEDAAGAEDTMSLPQRRGYVCKITDTKCDGVKIDRVVGNGGRELSGIRYEERERSLVRNWEGLGAGASDLEHGGVDVGYREVDGRMTVDINGLA